MHDYTTIKIPYFISSFIFYYKHCKNTAAPCRFQETAVFCIGSPGKDIALRVAHVRFFRLGQGKGERY